jgi:hypothetical protein
VTANVLALAFVAEFEKRLPEPMLNKITNIEDKNSS